MLAPRILEILRCDDAACKIRRSEDRYNPAPHPLQELRALFLHQLRICPDQYNCDLEHEVCELRAPHRDDRAGRNQPRSESFTRLFELIQKYVFSCVLAEFAFLCPEPPRPAAC